MRWCDKKIQLVQEGDTFNDQEFRSGSESYKVEQEVESFVRTRIEERWRWSMRSGKIVLVFQKLISVSSAGSYAKSSWRIDELTCRKSFARSESYRSTQEKWHAVGWLFAGRFLGRIVRVKISGGRIYHKCGVIRSENDEKLWPLSISFGKSDELSPFLFGVGDNARGSLEIMTFTPVSEISTIGQVAAKYVAVALTS